MPDIGNRPVACQGKNLAALHRRWRRAVVTRAAPWRLAFNPQPAIPRLAIAAKTCAKPRWNVAWSNIFLFGVLDIFGTLGLGVLLAVVIDRQVRFEGAFRTVFLYPLSISFIVTGLTWQWVLSPTIGVQNFVRGLGWSDFVFDWITRPDRAIYTLVFAGVWHQSGLIMAIMLAGLRGIDRDIWRVTRIEAIPPWRVYLSIVLPMLRPLLVTCIVLIAIAVVKSYDLVVAMTGGGPGYASDLPGKFVVDFAFERANIGQASAAALSDNTSVARVG